MNVAAVPAPIPFPSPAPPTAAQPVLPAAVRADAVAPAAWASPRLTAIRVRVIGRGLLRAAVETLLATRVGTASPLCVLAPSEPGHADVVIVLGNDGLDALVRVCSAGQDPAGGARVILMTGVRQTSAQVEEEFRAARRLGASVFVSDEDSVEVLCEAVEKAGRNEWYCSQALFPQIMSCLCETRSPAPEPAAAPAKQTAAVFSSAPNPTIVAPEGVLSSREEEIAFQAARGLSNIEIAAALELSVATVKFHLFNIYRKLGIVRRGQLGLVLQERYGVASFAAYQQSHPRAALRSRRVAAAVAA